MNNSLPNKYLLILIAALLIFCAYFTLFWDPNPSAKIKPFVEQRVALAIGVDFDLKKLVVVNPDNGQLVAPCKPIRDDNNQPTNGKKQLTMAKGSYKAIPDCAVQILTDSNPALASALEISENTIEGKIKKNGETIPATFVVTVTAVYKGSHCNTTSSSGNQHENCGHHGEGRP